MGFDAVVAQLLQYGMPGIVIIALGYAYWSRDGSFREVQEKRIVDAQANTEKLLTAMNAGTNALNTLTELIRATRGGRE